MPSEPTEPNSAAYVPLCSSVGDECLLSCRNGTDGPSERPPAEGAGFKSAVGERRSRRRLWRIGVYRDRERARRVAAISPRSKVMGTIRQHLGRKTPRPSCRGGCLPSPVGPVKDSNGAIGERDAGQDRIVVSFVMWSPCMPLSVEKP